jgi:hypothetical protein
MITIFLYLRQKVSQVGKESYFFTSNNLAVEFFKNNAWQSSHTVWKLGLKQKRIAEDAEVPASMTRNTQSQRNHNF